MKREFERKLFFVLVFSIIFISFLSFVVNVSGEETNPNPIYWDKLPPKTEQLAYYNEPFRSSALASQTDPRITQLTEEIKKNFDKINKDNIGKDFFDNLRREVVLSIYDKLGENEKKELLNKLRDSGKRDGSKISRDLEFLQVAVTGKDNQGKALTEIKNREVIARTILRNTLNSDLDPKNKDKTRSANTFFNNLDDASKKAFIDFLNKENTKSENQKLRDDFLKSYYDEILKDKKTYGEKHPGIKFDLKDAKLSYNNGKIYIKNGNVDTEITLNRWSKEISYNGKALVGIYANQGFSNEKVRTIIFEGTSSLLDLDGKYGKVSFVYGEGDSITISRVNGVDIIKFGGDGAAIAVGEGESLDVVAGKTGSTIAVQDGKIVGGDKEILVWIGAKYDKDGNGESWIYLDMKEGFKGNIVQVKELNEISPKTFIGVGYKKISDGHYALVVSGVNNIEVRPVGVNNKVSIDQMFVLNSQNAKLMNVDGNIIGKVNGNELSTLRQGGPVAIVEYADDAGYSVVLNPTNTLLNNPNSPLTSEEQDYVLQSIKAKMAQRQQEETQTSVSTCSSGQCGVMGAGPVSEGTATSGTITTPSSTIPTSRSTSSGNRRFISNPNGPGCTTCTPGGGCRPCGT